MLQKNNAARCSFNWGVEMNELKSKAADRLLDAGIVLVVVGAIAMGIVVFIALMLLMLYVVFLLCSSIVEVMEVLFGWQ